MYTVRGIRKMGTAAGGASAKLVRRSIFCDNIANPTHSSRYASVYYTFSTPVNRRNSSYADSSVQQLRHRRRTGVGTAIDCHIYNTADMYRRNGIGFEPVRSLLGSSIVFRPLSLDCLRNLHASHSVSDKDHHSKPSSKVEETVKAMKEKQEEQLKTPAVVEKRTLWKKVQDEILHYYHGFRLLFIDIRITGGLVNKILNGKSLSRREHKQLIRTTSDVFRLVPFSVFIIVPFMELLLPVFIKYFPGMLPSTFQTQNEREKKMKGELKVKLEMAKFLQETLDDMAVAGKGRSSQEAKEFAAFMHKMRQEGSEVSNEEILKFSKLFEDEITLDSLSRDQLVALCHVLEISTIGTTALLRFQLRMKLRSLAADDRVIEKEGVDTLNHTELQAACKARGMRALGVPEDRLKRQLKSWLELSLHKKVPPSLLLLSRAMYLPYNLPATAQLQASISALSETAAIQAKAAIGEREGKVDNKTRIQLIKEEQRKIAEEIAEEKMVEESKRKAKEEELVDKAPVLHDTAATSTTPSVSEPPVVEKIKPTVQALLGPEILRQGTATTVQETIERRLTKHVPHPLADAQKDPLTSEDLERIESALDVLGAQKRKLYIEKEELEDLKEELADYEEDVKDLDVISRETQVHESKAAKHLYKRVNKMIHKMEEVVDTLQKEAAATTDTGEKVPVAIEKPEEKQSQVIAVQELIDVINQVQDVSDPARMERIADLLENMDEDKDGNLKVDSVLKIVEMLGREHVKLHPDQVSEILSVLEKEESLKGNSEKQRPSSSP